MTYKRKQVEKAEYLSINSKLQDWAIILCTKKGFRMNRLLTSMAIIGGKNKLIFGTDLAVIISDFF